MSSPARQQAILLLCGFFLLIDQALKWLALNRWTQPRLLNRFFGWEPFHNPGIAFGVPIPTSLVLALTLPILMALAFFIYKKIRVSNDSHLEVAALGLLLVGALSNTVDRLRFSFTVDYFRIAYSIFNLADVLILLGFVIYLLGQKKKKTSSFF